MLQKLFLDDCTRVILLGNEDGDYINANYVNMEIPNGTINRYIAAQGPLPSTVKDFWRMVQQESSHLIVMLTTVLERGRVKCHQYWPSCNELLDMGDQFTVKCLSESPDSTGSFVDRSLIMSDGKTGEKRTIQHMQYLAWPGNYSNFEFSNLIMIKMNVFLDHGVPSDPKLFLDFTERVRLARNTTLLHEIEETLKQVRLKDADENGGLDGERKNYENGESPCELPPTTSVHQCISAANPPIIIHCSGNGNISTYMHHKINCILINYSRYWKNGRYYINGYSISLDGGKRACLSIRYRPSNARSKSLYGSKCGKYFFPILLYSHNSMIIIFHMFHFPRVNTNLFANVLWLRIIK